MPSPLPDDLAELISGQFRMLGEPMRLKILDRLRGGERSVGVLAEELGASQQNVSKHLQTLNASGILSRRKEGNTVFYSIGDPAMIEMCDQVCTSMEKRLEGMSSMLASLQGS